MLGRILIVRSTDLEEFPPNLFIIFSTPLIGLSAAVCNDKILGFILRVLFRPTMWINSAPGANACAKARIRPISQGRVLL